MHAAAQQPPGGTATPAALTWEYGPSAAGAWSVETTCLADTLIRARCSLGARAGARCVIRLRLHAGPCQAAAGSGGAPGLPHTLSRRSQSMLQSMYQQWGGPASW